MTIFSIDRHDLEQSVIEGVTSGDQLNLISRWVVMCVDLNDFDTRLSIDLHEEAAFDVQEDLTDLMEGNGEDREEAIRSREFTNGVA